MVKEDKFCIESSYEKNKEIYPITFYSVAVGKDI